MEGAVSAQPGGGGDDASVDTSGLMRNGARSGHYNTEPAAQVYVQINWSSKGL
jgi:hypothetical protein